MNSPTLRVAVLPRDANPYQALLYGAMADHGVTTTYLGELSRSHTVNVLALPAQVLARASEIDVVHLHWVWAFQLPGRRRSRVVGALSEAWFHVFLRAVRASGARFVWTAHNVLPHQPVFWDDVRARRALVAAADLVVVHHASTLDELAAIGVHPRVWTVVPHGPFGRPAAVPEVTAVREGPIRIGFVGAVATYKGIEDLLEAFGRLPRGTARLLVAGACTDPDLEAWVRERAGSLGADVDVQLRRLTDEELGRVLGEVDVLALPYRTVTTSGSALLGLGAGLPLVVPDLPALAGLPNDAVFRYPGPESLADCLAGVVGTPRDRLRAMGEAGRDAATAVSWEEIGGLTAQLFRTLTSSSAAALP